MKSLYLRIYATVVVVLLLFAVVSGWVLERHLDQERVNNEQVVGERLAAWAELLGRSLPPADAPADQQASALRDWSQRLRVPLALDAANGERIFASESFLRRSAEGTRPFAFTLEDGRTLSTMRPGFRARRGDGGDDRARRPGMPPPWPFLVPGLPRGTGLAIVLVVLFVAVAAGAYPVVRRLTRRLETLKQGVEQFGAGTLSRRVAVSGADEVAALATSFNVAAERIEALVQSHRSLLANASHELRSPLARLRMAVSMLEGATPAERVRLKAEIAANVSALHRDRVDLLAVAAEEAARVGAHVDGMRGVVVDGDERLLRRAMRNLLENGQRYAGGDLEVVLARDDGWLGGPAITVQVCDRGPGVPAAMREQIFEPFFRLPGHAEQAGGVGLGLALVKQIAERHGGSVRCEAREGGGSRFVMVLPAAPATAPTAARATP